MHAQKRGLIVFAALSALPSAVSAHHSFFGRFDTLSLAEIEGEVHRVDPVGRRTVRAAQDRLRLGITHRGFLDSARFGARSRRFVFAPGLAGGAK